MHPTLLQRALYQPCAGARVIGGVMPLHDIGTQFDGIVSGDMDKEHIRPIVICLFRRESRILISEAYDSSKGEYFCRPLGGVVEFGEHSREAMLREIREELGRSETAGRPPV
jgi:hypothetical protein